MFHNQVLKKRILIFGSNGTLGQRLTEYYSKNKFVELLTSSNQDESFVPNVDYVQADFCNREEVKNTILRFFPDYIINAAAFTNVDLSETERELAWKINVKGVEYITEASRVLDSRIIHFSTDYIFDGIKGPYHENDKANPLGYYARTKLASENVLRLSGTYHTIIRLNVLYGIAAKSRPDFVRWVVESLRNKKEIRIVTDQINNPTFIDDLIDAINRVIQFQRTGIYHIGGREFLSRYDFTLRIADFFNLDKSLIKPIITEELNQASKRPLKSGLITIKAESEIGFKAHSIEETFALMKEELNL
ncbi:MAG: dTDP-4-dehydrorhamnose reductase [Ignavibacteria bacterium]|nr:dTDP-4-dehydrorhamnose reductase [Ignavibacteria bacterium]